jgi:hypothetical protein
MITREQLEQTGLKKSLEKYWKGYKETYGKDPESRRHPDTVVGGVIRKAAYQKLVFGDNSDMLGYREICTATTPHGSPSNSALYFLTDDCLFGHDLLGFVTISQKVTNLTVGSRPGIEDGVIDTVDKYLQVFHAEEILIQDIDELLGYINLGRYPENHYEFIERVGKYVSTTWGHPENPALYLTAHGDKCLQYKDLWEDNGVPFNHGAYVYLLSHMAAYSKNVRQTERGWVDPGQWVITYYQGNPEFVKLISNCWAAQAHSSTLPHE